MSRRGVWLYDSCSARYKAERRLTPPLRVLLVEDNPGDIALVRSLLQDAFPGTILHIAHNGVEALHLLGYVLESPPSITVEVDLILLDMSMPKMNGLEFLRMPRPADHPPICLLTTGSDGQFWQEARQLGAADCQTKPADLDEYEAVLRKLVERWGSAQDVPVDLLTAL